MKTPRVTNTAEEALAIGDDNLRAFPWVLFSDWWPVMPTTA
jgi:hypothetical protein